MKKFLIAFLFTALLAFPSCDYDYSVNKSDAFYYFTDSVGREVVLKEKPQKVAVLFSSYAEVWQISGGTVDITVGDSIERGFACEDVVLVDEGSGHTTVNLELLIAEQPDFVIGTADYDCQYEACEFVSKHGIPSAVFRVDTFGDYLDMLKICCDINENPYGYTEYGDNVKNNIENMLALLKNETKSPKILFMRAGSSARSTKAKNSRDNFACAMLNELGAVNIADSAPVLLDGLSMEEIINKPPEYIFISPMGDETASRQYVESLLQTPVWQSLDCVKNGKYYFLPKDLFHYKPNHKWDTAYKYLIKILYPEIKID